MATIKERFKSTSDVVAAEIKELLKEHGSKKIGDEGDNGVGH
jgi:citrate synthase